MEKVQLKGFNELDKSIISRIKDIADKQANRMEKQFDDFTVELHMKEVAKKADKARYNVNAHIKTPQKNYSSAVVDWDVVKGVHVTLDSCNKAIDSDREKTATKKTSKTPRKDGN